MVFLNELLCREIVLERIGGKMDFRDDLLQV